MNTQPNYIDIADIIAEIENAKIEPGFEEVECDYYNEDDESMIAVGWIYNNIKTKNFDITYQESYSHKIEDPTEVETSSDVPESWQIYGIYPRVVVDNGETVCDYDLEQIIAEFTKIQEMDAAITLVMNQPAR